jgi:hypothetical protein
MRHFVDPSENLILTKFIIFAFNFGPRNTGENMKFGTYLYEPKKVEGFDFDVYCLKPETGRLRTPQAEMYNNIACFGDNVAAREHPDWVSVSRLGPAKMGNNNYSFGWDILCPSVKEYQLYLLDYIEETDKIGPGIWLSSIHFADHGHCTCKRCNRKWKESGLEWLDWRIRTVTEFIMDIKERVKKPLTIGLPSDPVNSDDRFGIDFNALAPYADAFNVVMCSTNYAAAACHWEMLAHAFKKILRKPVYISLSIRGPEDDTRRISTVDELLKVSVRTGRTGIDGILYFADTAERIREFQKASVDMVELRDELKTYGCQPVLDMVDRWEKIMK